MMNLQNVKGMMELQFNIVEANLVSDHEGVKYFMAQDGDFKDAIEVKVLSADGEYYEVYTRIPTEGVDIDVTVSGVSDEYFFVGHLMQPINVALIG
jgi:hypothetical protein